MAEYRRCDGCGSHVPATGGSCPSCGRGLDGLGQLLAPARLVALGGPALLAVLVVVFLPESMMRGTAAALVDAAVVGAGLAPLLVALTRVLVSRRRRDPSSYEVRMEETEARLEEVERDLARTEARLRAARGELEREHRPRLMTSLRSEVEQDRRLRSAQRRLAEQLEQRLASLAVERFRSELAYFEACRDAQVDAPGVAATLAAKIAAAQTAVGDAPAEPWARALEDARGLHHQLARGVERLHAARRLDPLRYADLTASDEIEAEAPSSEADLEAAIERHLERIDRGFDALDELGRELAGDADASGMRLRVDDDMIAALEAEEEELAIDPEARISVTGL